MVTDKMVDAARAAYSTATGCNDTPHVLDGWIEGALRAALEAALSASDAEPVCCGKPVHVGSPEGYTLECCGKLIKQPPAVAVKALDVDALAQEIRRVDGNHSLGAGALAEALLPFIRAALVSPADTSPIIPEGWQLVPNAATPEMIRKGVDLAMRVAITGEYRWTDYMADLYRVMLAAAPKEASHE